METLNIDSFERMLIGLESISFFALEVLAPCLFLEGLAFLGDVWMLNSSLDEDVNPIRVLPLMNLFKV